MIDRPRRLTLLWAAVCLGLFGLLAALIPLDRYPLDGVDQVGRLAEDWADGMAWLQSLLRGVEAVFATLPMTVYTVALGCLLLWRRHPRAAAYAVGVMLATSLVTTGTKAALARSRPLWQDSEGMLQSHAFPSGHASSVAAFAGVLAVLALLFLRRTNPRRASYAGLALLTVAVCLDRVLLGRHYPTDVLAGSLLGIGVVLLGLVVYDPLPRRQAASGPPLETVPTARQLAVVLNPVKVEDLDTFRTLVTAMADEAGWSAPRWLFTTIEDPGAGLAHEAAVAGADLVLVCGGDGTVREVCAELAGTGIPVGIIPAGTGNLLARNLQIPLFLRSAVDVALNGQDRAIDLVAVSGDGIEDTHFMVMAGMGMDAAIMEGVSEDIKKRVGWFAYVLSGLQSMMSPAVRIEIAVDGGDFVRQRARTVVVGNVGYLQAGMPLLPDASLDDGLLDVVLLHPRSVASWIPLFFRVLARRRHTDDTLNRMTGATVVIRTPHPTPRQLDGDSIGPGRELRMECLPGRVLVRVPR